MVTDCHIHISPIELFNPQALELMKRKRANFDEIAEYCRSPKAFLKISGPLRRRPCRLDQLCSAGSDRIHNRSESVCRRLHEVRSEAADLLRKPSSTALYEHHGGCRTLLAARPAYDQDSSSASTFFSKRLIDRG